MRMRCMRNLFEFEAMESPAAAPPQAQPINLLGTAQFPLQRWPAFYLCQMGLI